MIIKFKNLVKIIQDCLQEQQINEISPSIINNTSIQKSYDELSVDKSTSQNNKEDDNTLPSHLQDDDDVFGPVPPKSGIRTWQIDPSALDTAHHFWTK